MPEVVTGYKSITRIHYLQNGKYVLGDTFDSMLIPAGNVQGDFTVEAQDIVTEWYVTRSKLSIDRVKKEIVQDLYAVPVRR